MGGAAFGSGLPGSPKAVPQSIAAPTAKTLSIIDTIVQVLLGGACACAQLLTLATLHRSAL